MADRRSTIRAAQSGTLLTQVALASTRTKTNPAERAGLVDAFVTLLEGLYAHLPLKRAMYAVDPLQRLRLLARRAATLEELAFHYELAATVTALRDAHTRYLGPASLADQVAMLPFLVESYGAPPRAGYLVSKIATDPRLIGDSNFVPGVELVTWNAVPFDRAVDLHAESETGGRPDSRRARALESLTLRSLQFGPPPDERWVVVGYRDAAGHEREVRIPWRVVKPGRAGTAGFIGDPHGHRRGIDPAREAARRGKKLLFAPEQWYADQHPGQTARRGKLATSDDVFPTSFQDQITARIAQTRAGRFGYLRLWSFDVADDVAFIQEVIRLLEGIDAGGAEGLILDLRANPGGLIWAAERMLQLFGPGEVAPTRFSFLATSLTRAMANAGQNQQELEPWLSSLEDAVATGEPYSQAVPITSFEQCNDVGQVYGGPVVAVVDANTYSAGDLFAAGFYDNDLGILVTVGEATGAGGANVWWSEQVRESLVGTPFARAPLPQGIDYSMAVRRATRGAGEAIGTAIEDVGVRGHRTYAMTKADLTGTNQDLLEFCGKRLASQPSTRMVAPRPAPGGGTIDVGCRGLDRLDLYVDGRPRASADVADGNTGLDVPAGWNVVEVSGFFEGVLRQRRRFSQ